MLGKSSAMARRRRLSAVAGGCALTLLVGCSTDSPGGGSTSTAAGSESASAASTSAAAAGTSSGAATNVGGLVAGATGTVADLTLTSAQLAAAKQAGGKVTVGLLAPLSSEYLANVVSGAKAEAGVIGVKTISVDYQFDDAKAVAGIENLVSKGVKYIVAVLTDPPAMLGAVKAAQAAGVTVIQFAGNQVAKSTGKGYSVAVDDQVLGTAIGKATAQVAKTRGKVQIAILDYPSQPNVVIRANAMRAAIKAGAPQAQIVGSQTGGTQEAGLTASENLLQRFPKLAGIASVNDAGGYGAVQAFTSAGRNASTAFVVGCDAESKAVQQIRAGSIFKATVDTQPTLTGKVAVDIVGKLLAGAKVDQYTTVPVKTITK